MAFRLDTILLDSKTTAERDAIVLPPNGLTIFNGDTDRLETNDGTPAAPNWVGAGTSTIAPAAGDDLGNHTATEQIKALDGTVAAPGLGFKDHTGTGWWVEPSGDMASSVNGLEILEIQGDGRVIISSAVPNYETLVTADNVLANKKYVDDVVTASSGSNQKVQARRTTAFTVPNGTPALVTFDTTEVESNDSILKHDLVNTGRIYLYSTEYHLGALNFVFDNSNAQNRTVTIELWKNGTTMISSLDFPCPKSEAASITRTLILPPCSSGDYITVRLGASNSGITLAAKAVVQIIQSK